MLHSYAQPQTKSQIENVAGEVPHKSKKTKYDSPGYGR